MKIVIFDLDETLGYFVEFGMFWDCLNKYLLYNSKYELTQDDFNYILDLYPEVLRPHIIAILNYLKHKKENKCCNKLMIYTNNQGTELWANKLIHYFEKKIQHKLFDQIIAAFKINGKAMEICRTTHDKTYHDLIKCTKIPLHAKICYLDDSYFPEMSHKNVYYINVKPYIHDLPFETMISRFLESEFGKKIIEDSNNFTVTMMKYLNSFIYTYVEKRAEEQDIDKIISKQIMIHLQHFFNHSLKNKKTKNKHTYKNKTRKNNN